MDDFYGEMKETLDGLSEKQNQRSSESISPSQDSTYLAHYFPSMFAEALVPVNPGHWPAYTAGSAAGSDMPDWGDKLKNPLDNLVAMGEYLDTAQSDLQWRARMWQVLEDTTTVNAICESGQDAGAFTAGILANKMADRYVDEAVVTQATANDQEQLNLQIFKRTALDKNLDPSNVRGRGVSRQYVPDYMQGDLCDRPGERNARPKPFDDNGLFDGGVLISSDSGGPSKNDDGGLNLSDEPSIDGSSEFDTSSDSNGGSIFGRFFEGDGSSTDTPGGTGINPDDHHADPDRCESWLG